MQTFKKIITISFVIFNFIIVYSQNLGKINGKLILTDLKNKEFVLKNTYVILKSKTKIDSVKIDKTLTFTFDNLKADTIRIYTNPRSYPTNKFYIIKLKQGEIKNIDITYNPVCPYKKDENNICPVCKKKDKVIPIVYGLYLNNEEKKGKRKSKRGGCVVSDCQPSWFCERDKKEF